MAGIGIRTEDQRDGGTGEIEDDGQEYGDAGGKEQGRIDTLVGPVRIPGADVLANEGGDRRAEAHHGQKHKAVDLHQHGISGDELRTETVGKRLDDEAAPGEAHVLQSGGEAEAQDMPGDGALDVQMVEIDLCAVDAGSLAAQHQASAEDMGQDRSQRNTGHIPVENADKEQVQQDIGNAGDNQGIHGPFRVAQALYHAVHVVVDHVAASARKNDPDVESRIVQDIRRGPQHPQHGFCADEADDGDEQPGQHAEQEGGGHGFFQLFDVFCAFILGNHNVGAHTDAHIQGVEYHHNGKAGVDGGEAMGAVGSKVADHNGVYDVIQLLKQVSENDGQGKQDDLFGDRALG